VDLHTIESCRHGVSCGLGIALDDAGNFRHLEGARGWNWLESPRP
jgi:hypothetical protein